MTESVIMKTIKSSKLQNHSIEKCKKRWDDRDVSTILYGADCELIKWKC
jgi:hypothetical protein